MKCHLDTHTHKERWTHTCTEGGGGLPGDKFDGDNFAGGGDFTSRNPDASNTHGHWEDPWVPRRERFAAGEDFATFLHGDIVPATFSPPEVPPV